MRKLAAPLVFAALCALPSAFEGVPPQGPAPQDPAQLAKARAEDSEKIARLMVQMKDAWNARNTEKYVEPFTEDAELVLWNGMLVKGKKAIRGGQDLAFRILYRESQIRAELVSIRFARPDLALVYAKWDLKPTADAKENIRTLGTMVFVKAEDQWRLESFSSAPIP